MKNIRVGYVNRAHSVRPLAVLRRFIDQRIHSLQYEHNVCACTWSNRTFFHWDTFSNSNKIEMNLFCHFFGFIFILKTSIFTWSNKSKISKICLACVTGLSSNHFIRCLIKSFTSTTKSCKSVRQLWNFDCTLLIARVRISGIVCSVQ